MTISKDGAMEGYLAGYTSVEDMYEFEYSFREGKDGNGKPANQRLIKVSSIGKAATLGHTCQGAYYALHEQADGHPDPATGRCTSISTQYRIKAIPAFVIDEVETQSANENLVKQ